MNLKQLLLLVSRATWALRFEKDREGVMRFLVAELKDRWGISGKDLREVMEELEWPVPPEEEEETE